MDGLDFSGQATPVKLPDFSAGATPVDHAPDFSAQATPVEDAPLALGVKPIAANADLSHLLPSAPVVGEDPLDAHAMQPDIQAVPGSLGRHFVGGGGSLLDSLAGGVQFLQDHPSLMGIYGLLPHAHDAAAADIGAIHDYAQAAHDFAGNIGDEKGLLAKVAGVAGESGPTLAAALTAPEVSVPEITAEAAPALSKIPGLLKVARTVAAQAPRASALTALQAGANPNETPSDAARNLAINAVTFGVPGAVGETPLTRATSGALIGPAINTGATLASGQTPTLESNVFAALQGALGGGAHGEGASVHTEAKATPAPTAAPDKMAAFEDALRKAGLEVPEQAAATTHTAANPAAPDFSGHAEPVETPAEAPQVGQQWDAMSQPERSRLMADNGMPANRAEQVASKAWADLDPAMQGLFEHRYRGLEPPPAPADLPPDEPIKYERPFEPVAAPEPEPEPVRQWYPTGRQDSRGRPILAPQLDYSRDTLLHWLGVNGGINFDSLRQNADADRTSLSDPDVMRPFGRVGFPAMRRLGGMTLDQARERMQQDGWLPQDSAAGTSQVGDDDAAQKILDALNGYPVHHPFEGADERMMRQAHEYLSDEAAHQLANESFADSDEAAKQEALAHIRAADASIKQEDMSDALTATQWLHRAREAGLTLDDALEIMGDGTMTKRIGRLARAVQDQEANHGLEQRATVEPGEVGVPPDTREGGSAAGDFGLEADSTPAAQNARAGARADLFPAATAREQVAAASRAKDDARNGNTGRVIPGFEGTDLGATPHGEAPEQGRLDQVKRSESSGQQAQSGVPEGLPVEQTDATRRLAKAVNRDIRSGKDQGAPMRFREINPDSLPDSLHQALSALERFGNLKVHVIRNMNAEETGIRFNGVTLGDGHLYVDEHSEFPAVTVASHEFLHQLRKDAPDLYDELQVEVERQIREGTTGKWGDWVAEATKRGYKPHEMPEELVADATGDALTDPVFLNRMAERNPSAFRTLAQHFINFINRFLGRARDLGSNPYLSDVAAFRDKLADVLDRFASERAQDLSLPRRGTLEVEPGEPDYSRAALDRGNPDVRYARRQGPQESAGEADGADNAPPAELPRSLLSKTLSHIIPGGDEVASALRMAVAPMAEGSVEARATAKDFANHMREARFQGIFADKQLTKHFTREQLERMWDAADEQSVLEQKGEPTEGKGLATLAPDERRAVEILQANARKVFEQARALGMVEGEGLPSYTPRMVVRMGDTGPRPFPNKDNPISGNAGRNVRTTSPSLRQRLHLTAAETEAAAKAKLGEDAELVRNVRTLPLATSKLAEAVAGRALINRIREIGKQTGQDTVREGAAPDNGFKWFTISHPAFTTWRPRFESDPESGKVTAVKDEHGNTVFDRVPIYVRGDFAGPLKAVLSEKSGPIYNGLMSLKGKTMSVIMYSPLIHNAVEWGRALPAMPGKVATFQVYFEGNRAKNDPAAMREAINAGLVPIGQRYGFQDISSIQQGDSIIPGQSWTAKLLAAVPNLFDKRAGDAVKRAVDKLGDVWHNKLLWDRVGDLQMGLYSNFRDHLTHKGFAPDTAQRMAAHFANRYAGALPMEAMSNSARKIANLLLFSRSFTLGNLGAMKDMVAGLPRDVQSQILRDRGLDELTRANSYSKRKAMTIIAADMALMYLGNSLLQSGIAVARGTSTLDEEAQAYADRLAAAFERVKENPLALLHPFNLAESLTPMSGNEPGKQDRVLVGHAPDGTAIYMRNPTGKIGEEFQGWLTSPLDMLKRKMGTIARPLYELVTNDRGFGRKVYDPYDDSTEGLVKNAGRIAALFVGDQVPTQSIKAVKNAIEGNGDTTINVLQAAGPLAGLTFSKGAPGGPAVGLAYQARDEHDFAVNEAMPDIRDMIRKGDDAGAIAKMRSLGMPPSYMRWVIRTTNNPALRLSPKGLRDFGRYATPERQQAMQDALGNQ